MTQKLYKKTLFIFRRDLRLYDNRGLRIALEQSVLTTVCFIFDDRQIGEENLYRSKNAIEFMIESLNDLEEQLLLHKGFLNVFWGNFETIMSQIFQRHKFDAVFCNRDYTPFSKSRDISLEAICKEYNVIFKQYNDYLLNEPEDIITQKNSYYLKFTPFYKKSKLCPVSLPENGIAARFCEEKISPLASSTIYTKILIDKNLSLSVHGGRKNALSILNTMKKFSSYEVEHNFPEKHTTKLSAHLKFGTISIREAYQSFKKNLGENTSLLRQLYWRDFFTHIAYHCPTVFGHAFEKKFDSISWHENKEYFSRWCSGETGFPIVDAGMRELNTTGFMHNRVRLIVGSLLTKDLHINWQWGEKYFAQHLVDYDPCVNNGNWQWIASTGCDSQPYFRIFNPWLQQKKFDPDCVYIKKWIPELANSSKETIHSWYKNYQKIPTRYPKALVDHAQESLITKKLFKRL